MVGQAAAGAAVKLLPESVWLALDPVDMRTGVDGLSLHVQQALGRAPCDGTAYVFSNRRRTRLKVVSWDGTGVWMCLRRLHRGQFVWPEPGDKCWQLSAEQWQWLVMGVDWQRLSAQAPSQWRL
ncbi:IS66 family insertion sequence element accessory protein TnpB [Massilia varians]|uniref:IS66 family insertion sequence element accessory protein TnpB n=1 Tax=Massilia varians TaxID=457921 RepID=UPI0024937B91|nr:IS66 family insertion sequence element accessory protein TnpB [Massilia varians]